MKKDSKKIAVLIPCYNESKTIKKVIKDYKEVLPEADIYVYDNNSTDGTDEIARKAGAIVKYVDDNLSPTTISAPLFNTRSHISLAFSFGYVSSPSIIR